MAKAVKEIPSISDYPWEEWLKVGAKWQLTQGEDFDVGLKSMSCQCHTAAKRFNVGVTVRVRSEDKAVFLEVFEKGKGKKFPKGSGRKNYHANTVAITAKKPTTKSKKKKTPKKEPVTNG